LFIWGCFWKLPSICLLLPGSAITGVPSTGGIFSCGSPLTLVVWCIHPFQTAFPGRFGDLRWRATSNLWSCKKDGLILRWLFRR
jgi:hypothetical protein